jgi:hypothetical protein
MWSEGPGEKEGVLVLLQQEDGHHPDAIQDQEGHHHLSTQFQDKFSFKISCNIVLRYKVENFKPNKRQEFFLSFSITPY